MSQTDRRFRLLIDVSAAADLSRVRREDRWAHAQIVTVLQEYESGALPAEELIDERFESKQIENIKPFWHLQDKRLNVYRIKLVSVNAWRILTAGDHAYREVAVLAIMRRDQNYQSDKALIERLRKSYENFGFKRLGF